MTSPYPIDENYGRMSSEKELREWLSQDEAILNAYDSFMVKLQKRTITSAFSCAKETFNILIQIIEKFDFDDLEVVFKQLRSMGYYLLKQQPMALSIGNVILRLISILSNQANELAQDSNNSLVNPSLESTLYKNQQTDKFKIDQSTLEDYRTTVIEMIENDILHDITSAYESIQLKCESYISDSDVIMIHGESHTVTQLLISMNKTKKIHIVQCESAPIYNGHASAKHLASSSIPTTLIPDSNIYNIMRQTNKVILSAHTVLANGGVLCQSGGYLVAMAAKHYHVPVIILAGQYKLCPIYTNDQHQYNDLNSPQNVLPFSKRDPVLIKANVINPCYDYIPSEYINVIITSTGEYAPSSIFRLIRESYTLRDILHPIAIQKDF